MQTFLTQPRVAKAILLEKDKMLATLMEDQKAEIKEKAMKTIQLCLFDEISREVLVEKTIIDLWPKLESLYMMKLLTKVVFKELFLHIYIYIYIYIYYKHGRSAPIKTHLYKNITLIKILNIYLTYEFL
jgi:hypothetical protein